MIPFSNRFHGHGSLSFVYKNGQTVRSKLMSVRYVKNRKREKSRIAVVVSKKIYKSAVNRNRIRRRIYEYVRTILDRFEGVYDIVFIVSSREVKDIPHDEIKGIIDKILSSAGIVK